MTAWSMGHRMQRCSVLDRRVSEWSAWPTQSCGGCVPLLPTEKEANGRWNTLEWSKKRTGWLFLPSTNTTPERLMPLTSLWLDLLVMRLFA